MPVLNGRASTQRALARFAKIEQPPMAQMLTRMEHGGLIERTVDAHDRRSHRIVLTEAALARMPDAIAALLQGNRDALDIFTGDETEHFLALLARLIANLDRIASAEA